MPALFALLAFVTTHASFFAAITAAVTSLTPVLPSSAQPFLHLVTIVFGAMAGGQYAHSATAVAQKNR